MNGMTNKIKSYLSGKECDDNFHIFSLIIYTNQLSTYLLLPFLLHWLCFSLLLKVRNTSDIFYTQVPLYMVATVQTRRALQLRVTLGRPPTLCKKKICLMFFLLYKVKENLAYLASPGLLDAKQQSTTILDFKKTTQNILNLSFHTKNIPRV